MCNNRVDMKGLKKFTYQAHFSQEATECVPPK